MAGGRPTKYSDEVLEAAKDYLENCPDVLPSVVGLAVQLGIVRKTLMLWAKDEEKAEFCYTLDQIEDAQHMSCLNKGITGEYNSAITKLILHNHGYSDRQDNISSDGSMSPQKKDFNDFYEEGTE